MLRYIEADSFLHRRNPMIKALVLLVQTVIISLSYYPTLPVLTFLLLFIVTTTLGKLSWRVFTSQLKAFVLIAGFFMLSMGLMRGISPSENPEYFLGPLSWSRAELISIVTLGTRILAFVGMTVSFVATTRPRDLVLSLIRQLGIPPLQGYSIMAAYRFLPELQGYVDAIHLAQSIRGIHWKKGLGRLTSPFRVFIPLFCLAARRSDRVACSMESRGLGRTRERTYFKSTRIDRGDWLYMIAMGVFYAVVIFLLVKSKRFYFRFGLG